MRETAVSKAMEGFGGGLEAIYYAFGDDDVFLILDLPGDSGPDGNVSAPALSIAVPSSGLVRSKITSLPAVEEADKALQKSVIYRAPGT